MIRIDFENHYITKDMYAALKENPGYPRYDDVNDVMYWVESVAMGQGHMAAPMMLDSPDRIATMDANGVTQSILAASPGLEQLPDALSVAACRAANDATYATCQAHPGRLLGTAILPVNDVEAACAELERCVNEYGFVGWHTHSNYGETTPDDAKYLPIYKTAERLQVYVHMHPHIPTDPRLLDYGFPLAGAGLGFTLDALTTTTRMILSGLFDACPNLKILLGHLGECFPFMLERMEDRMHLGDPRVKSQHPLSYYFKRNIWVSTSGNQSKDAFMCCMNTLGLDRMVFATDYPHERLEKTMDFLNNLPLSQEEKEQLFYKNGEALLPPKK